VGMRQLSIARMRDLLESDYNKDASGKHYVKFEKNKLDHCEARSGLRGRLRRGKTSC